MNRPAGFWVRLLAIIADTIVLSFINMFFILFLGESSLFYALSAVIGWLYFAGLESSSRQATLGKMLFSLKVTDLSGNRISFARATGRYFSKAISTLLLFLGYLMVAFSSRKQGLHDKIASTLVVRKNLISNFDRWQDDDSGYGGDR
ncbi:hypothetical protein BEP19_14575 [Ammoniphilus oxalaticus]|uniref:RDD domain-containing protein n=1 Tax=Ammoniphilus oxalaticus TaxID=66863 RepID=A0A419SEU0_9BACL|nr:RDD family protein [Ammoniphilus oxalaticus]RKD21833.1 hypothetical protein BEP19_14575 [Ammoniphilus oxalaticus]